MAEPLSPGSSDLDSVASLPSSSASSETLTETEGERTRREEDAEREWKESLQQLELLLTMVVVPYVGKYFGRKAAYWGWGKYMHWRYPVDILMTSSSTFKATGAVEAAASL